MTTDSNSTSTSARRSGITAGIILILCGLIAFAANIVQTEGALFMGALALIFVTASVIRRSNGLAIPGGILAGLASGVFLVENVYKNAAEPFTGGMFLLAFAGGWVLVSLLSLAIAALNQNRAVMVWPLIPAGGLALTGGLILSDNVTALELMGKGWPLVLVIIGASILLRRGQNEEK